MQDSRIKLVKTVKRNCSCHFDNVFSLARENVPCFFGRILRKKKNSAWIRCPYRRSGIEETLSSASVPDKRRKTGRMRIAWPGTGPFPVYGESIIPIIKTKLKPEQFLIL